MAEHKTADVITSRENRWVKLFRAGLRGAGPSGDEAIAVEGPKLIEDALRHGIEAEALLVSETGERGLERVLRAASASETGIARSRVLRTTDKIFERLSGTESPQGVAALFRQPAWDFEDILGAKPPRGAGAGRLPHALVLVMAGVQDPGNVGTIAVRASAGSALRLPLLRGMSVPVLLAQLRVSQIKVVAAGSAASNGSAPDGVKIEADLREPVAIFIGNEGVGLPGEIESAADFHFLIPMSETVESLNAGIAASILLHEAARQRKA
jgi:TrmH family RNA methyltransferase